MKKFIVMKHEYEGPGWDMYFGDVSVVETDGVRIPLKPRKSDLAVISVPYRKRGINLRRRDYYKQILKDAEDLAQKLNQNSAESDYCVSS